MVPSLGLRPSCLLLCLPHSCVPAHGALAHACEHVAGPLVLGREALGPPATGGALNEQYGSVRCAPVWEAAAIRTAHHPYGTGEPPSSLFLSNVGSVSWVWGKG